MNPRAFQELASVLATKADATSAELRSAVSRAYYALYNVAVALLKKMGVRHQNTGELHQLVPDALRYGRDESVGVATRVLVEIRKMRWSADYDMDDDAVEDQRTVRKLVAQAKQAIKKLDECQADTTRFIDARVKIRNWVGSAAGAGKGFSLAS